MQQIKAAVSCVLRKLCIHRYHCCLKQHQQSRYGKWADLQGLIDLLPGGLGGIQRVDELNVIQQAACSTGQQLQNLVLQLSLHTSILFVC